MDVSFKSRKLEGSRKTWSGPEGNLETSKQGEACEGPSVTEQVWAQLAAKKDVGAPTPCSEGVDE